MEIQWLVVTPVEKCPLCVLALAGAGIGMAGGVAVQYTSDVLQNVQINGGWSTSVFWHYLSPGREYVKSATKGTVVGATMPLAGAAEIGYIAMGGVAAAVNGLTSIGFDKVTHQSVDYAKTAEDSALTGLTAGILDTAPKVPGRVPNFFTNSFFTGAHTQRMAAEEFFNLGTQQAMSASLTMIAPSAMLSLSTMKGMLQGAQTYLSSLQNSSQKSSAAQRVK